jgi:hypothetical protein
VSREDNPDVFYGLNRKFEGAAKKPPRGIVNRKQRSGARISGCWVCGKDHMARANHPAVEVREALAKHRSNNAYLSADSIGELYIEEEESCDDGNTDPECEEANICIVEETINVAFLAGTYKRHYDDEMRKMRNELKRAYDHVDEFEGLILDSAANRRSTMCYGQYKTYCKMFGVRMNLKPSSGQNIKGIGGRRSTMGTAVVPVPFPNLKLILDVEFAIIPGDDTPSLLSLRDMR